MDRGGLKPAEGSGAPQSEPASVLELYQEALQKRGFQPDDSQRAAVQRYMDR